jgi:hypothetical protein
MGTAGVRFRTGTHFGSSCQRKIRGNSCRFASVGLASKVPTLLTSMTAQHDWSTPQPKEPRAPDFPTVSEMKYGAVEKFNA